MLGGRGVQCYPWQSCTPSPSHKGIRLIKKLISYTDKQENQIFLIYKEIQSGAVAKTYMRKGFLIYEEMRKYFPIYEEAVSHILLCNCSIMNFLISEKNLIFFFISAAFILALYDIYRPITPSKIISKYDICNKNSTDVLFLSYVISHWYISIVQNTV